MDKMMIPEKQLWVIDYVAQKNMAVIIFHAII